MNLNYPNFMYVLLTASGQIDANYSKEKLVAGVSG